MNDQTFPFASRSETEIGDSELARQSLRLRIETAKTLADLVKSIRCPSQTQQTLGDTLGAIAALRTLYAIIGLAGSASDMDSGDE